MEFEQKVVPLSELKVDPSLVPPTDERYMARLELCLKGEIPLTWAMVPIGNLIPSFPSFAPHGIPKLTPVIEALERELRAGKPPQLFVYPESYWFVVSDDYPPYFAHLNCQSQFVPCFVLGEFDHPLVREVKRVRDEDVSRILFGA